MLWKQEVKPSQIFSDPNYINVKTEDMGQVWRFTGMYGDLKWSDKYKTWRRMRALKAQHNLPWLIMGDFNEILSNNENVGGNPRPHQYMQAFQDVLNEFVLIDLGFTGDMFTWYKGNIKERLDRGVGTKPGNNSTKTL